MSRKTGDGKKNKKSKMKRCFPFFSSSSSSSSSSASSSALFLSTGEDNLLVAIKEGKTIEALELIASGVDLRGGGVPERMPLNIAILYERLEITKSILKQINPSAKIPTINKTPLFLALENNKMIIVEYMVSVAGISLRREEALTILMADKTKIVNKNVLWLLEHNGIIVSPPILAYAVEHASCELVETLIEKGKANVNDVVANPLAIAMKKGRKDMVEMLFRLGAKAHNTGNIDIGDYRGTSDVTKKNEGDSALLCGAVANNWMDIVLRMINMGVNVNGTVIIAPEFIPTSPLYIAIQLGYYDIARLLIEHGAVVTKRPDNLLDAPTLMHMVSRRGGKLLNSVGIATLLIEKGADVNAPWIVTGKKECPIHAAVKSKYVDMIYLLIYAGADITVEAMYNNVTASVWDLSEDDTDVKRALYHHWEPKIHKYHTKKVKDAVFCVLLVAKRLQWNFDNTVLYKILSFVASPSGWHVS